MDEQPSAPATAAPVIAVCAVHEGAPSTGTCERCGNFVCPLCLDPRDVSPLCAACRDRAGGGTIPWEREEGSWLARYWQTARAVVFRPSATLHSVRPGSVGSALGFAALTGFFLGLTVALLMGCALGAFMGFASVLSLPELDASSFGGVAVIIGIVLLYPIGAPIAMLVSVMVRGLVYHGAVAAAGGRGGIGSSLWAVSYLHAIHLTALPLLVIQQLPIIGPIIGLVGYVAIEVFYGLQLTVAARRYHGLEGGRASLAGWAPSLLLFALVVGCCVLAVVFAVGLAGRFPS